MTMPFLLAVADLTANPLEPAAGIAPTWPFWQLGLGLLVSIFLDAFFSAAGQTLTALEPAQLEEAAEEGDEQAAKLLTHLERRERLVGVALSGATLALVMGTLFALEGVRRLFPQVSWLAVLMPLGLFLALVGDALPRAWALGRHWQRAGALLAPLRFSAFIFAPAVWLVDQGGRVFARAFPTQNKLDSLVTREELRELLVEAASEEIKPHERQMLRRVLDFGSLTVQDAMVPLSRVEGISDASPLRNALALLSGAGHSRLPVYRRRLEQIIGMVSAYDILFVDDLDASVRSVQRPCKYVQQSVPLERLLADLQRSQMGMAIVISDAGLAVGIITVEDILEQIVGDIKDEFD